MTKHIVHFIGPINHNSACTVRNLCLQALQSGASEIELHMSTEGRQHDGGLCPVFLPEVAAASPHHATTSAASNRSAWRSSWPAQKRYACPGTRFLVHPLNWGFGSLVAADHARVTEWRDCLDFDAERYASIFDEATRGAAQARRYPHPSCSAAPACSMREQAVEAGIVHEAAPGPPAAAGRDFALVELVRPAAGGGAA